MPQPSSEMLLFTGGSDLYRPTNSQWEKNTEDNEMINPKQNNSIICGPVKAQRSL